MSFFKVFETSGSDIEQIEEFKEDFTALLNEARSRYESRYNSEILAASLVGDVDLWDGKRSGGLIVETGRTVIDAIRDTEIDDFTVLIDLETKDQFVFWLHHHDGTHEFRSEWLNERKLLGVAPTYLREGQIVGDEVEKLAIETRPFIRFEKWMEDYIGHHFSQDIKEARRDWAEIQKEKRREHIEALREEKKTEIEQAKKREEEQVDFRSGINDKFRHVPISKVNAYSTFRNFGKKAKDKGIIEFRATTAFLTQCYTKDAKPYEFLITRYHEKNSGDWLWKAEDPVVFSLIRNTQYFSFVEAYLETKRIVSEVEYDKLLTARDKSKSLVNSLVGEPVEFPEIAFIEELNDEERAKFIQNDVYFSNLLEEEGKK